MSEQDVIERFGQDLDDLLRQREPDQWEAAPPDYQLTLDVARALAANDMSGESQRRYATRQRLLTEATVRWEREARRVGDGFWQHPMVALPLALVTLAVVCALILPGSSSWSHIGQPELSLPAIETPVAAAQTAYAEFRGFGAAPTSAMSPTQIAPTPTQTASGQSLPANFFIATGTPVPLLP